MFVCVYTHSAVKSISGSFGQRLQRLLYGFAVVIQKRLQTQTHTLIPPAQRPDAVNEREMLSIR